MKDGIPTSVAIGGESTKAKRDAALDVVRRHYPRAMTTNETVDWLFDLMERRFGMPPSKIMHADSICSDDVNAIEYPPRAREMLGPFNMGGLDGFPFTGLTGMGAFAGHVPVDGAVFVFYAPHIGVMKDGTVGQILRVGQTKPSGCCGAARAALAKLSGDAIAPGEVTDLDYQQNTIEQILLLDKARILVADNPLIAATEVIYEAIEERIDVLAKRTQYPCGWLVLMGGILINSDHDVGSFCEPEGSSRSTSDPSAAATKARSRRR